jgi:hypothetical protein
MTMRAGVTRRVRLSIHEDDPALLKRRAKRVHGGNALAVLSDIVARIRREEALRKAFAWYGKPIVLTDDERKLIDRELLGGPVRRRRDRRPHARTRPPAA